MPVTQADLDELDKAIATGERQVTLNGQSISYRSVDEMLKARAHLERQMAKERGSRRPRRQKLYYGGRGFD